MKLQSLKCPECRAILEIEEGRPFCYCQYCGTKIMIDDGSTTYTYHKIDEARLREAEIKRDIRLKELEIEERKRVAKERTRATKIKASILLGIIGSILLVVGFLGGEATGNPDSGLYMLAYVGLFAFIAIAWIWLGDNNKDK